MAIWDSLIRFRASDDREYWASLPLDTTPAIGLSVQGYQTIDDLESGSVTGVDVTVAKVCFPKSPHQKRKTRNSHPCHSFFLLPYL